MTCQELDDRIEALAAGDEAVTPAIQAHLDACASCREALSLARAIEWHLSAQPAPAVPDRFVPNVLARVRRARWQSERRLDLAFNAVLALAVIVAVGGLYAILTVTGVSVVAADVGRMFVGGFSEAIRLAYPQLRLYTAATVLAASCFALWWWAERGFEL
jgi:predicted anti-sigma-YlaC factor YlaD